MDWKAVYDGGTLLVAVWGAALSTFIYFKQRADRKPRIRTELGFGLLGWSSGQTSDRMIFLIAKNAGLHTVRLQVPFLQMSDGRTIIALDPGGDVRFPCDLQPGRSCRAWISLAEVEDQLFRNGCASETTVIGVYRDELGTEYRSKPSTVTPAPRSAHE